ncbi:MAG: hypothetical protein JRI59_06370 [Deltaproteobacteria bacterium]|nr:hypothetical protein [Deltaproteobacteria bacterium]MBW1991728.1 hypothetical protein [Deltaproteobacteria bacterium]
MTAFLKDILNNLSLGPGVTHANLTVFPVHHEGGVALPYLSLDKALELGVVEITEVGGGGEVPNVSVANRGDTPVLILAGEELVGAKQNRLVNATFLLAGNTRLILPVSCVEQGRWSPRTARFQSQKRLSSYLLRSRVHQDVSDSLKAGRGFRADQMEVWDEIRDKAARLGVASPTGAMADIFESYEDQLRHYTQSFPLSPHQKGLLAVLNGRPAGLEVFDSHPSLARYFDKLIQSYALDALDLHLQGPSSSKPRFSPEAWLEEVQELPVTASPSLSLGEDLRVKSRRCLGAGLRYQGVVLYLSIFAQNRPGKSGLARASRRGSLRRII